jgi:hypothetical protein
MVGAAVSLSAIAFSEDRSMKFKMLTVCSMVALVLVAGSLAAADRPGKTQQGDFNPAAHSVDIFEGIKNGQLEVRVIPKDSTLCRITIQNKTDKPLSVKLPEAFAAIPVLAQVGGAGGAGGVGARTTTTSRQPQPMMGGMGGMGMGGMMPGMGMGMGGGFFNIAPDQVGQLKVPTVCLEHGKAEPRSTMKYELRPIEEYSQDKALHEIGRMLGRGQISQRVAQVATWHLNSKMSFDQLARKELRFANGTRQPYFSAEEIRSGMQVVAAAVAAAQKAGQPDSTSTAVSKN